MSVIMSASRHKLYKSTDVFSVPTQTINIHSENKNINVNVENKQRWKATSYNLLKYDFDVPFSVSTQS